MNNENLVMVPTPEVEEKKTRPSRDLVSADMMFVPTPEEGDSPKISTTKSSFNESLSNLFAPTVEESPDEKKEAAERPAEIPSTSFYSALFQVGEEPGISESESPHSHRHRERGDAETEAVEEGTGKEGDLENVPGYKVAVIATILSCIIALIGLILILSGTKQPPDENLVLPDEDIIEETMPVQGTVFEE